MTHEPAARTISIIDQTLRDGPQSWWGMRMQRDMAVPAAAALDRTGFHAVDLIGPNIFDVLIKRHQENPWDTTTAILQQITATPTRAAVRSNGLFGFGLDPFSINELWVRQLCEKGVRSFWIYDGLFNIEKIARLTQVMHEYGAEAVACVLFADSPFHTDGYYVDVVRDLAAVGVDAIELEDASGVLTPDRTRSLVRAIKQTIGTLPLEAHFHSNTGLAPLNYLVAVEEGVERVHTASRPLANGVSLPSTEVTVANLRIAGYTVNVDDSLFPEVAEHMTTVAQVEGLTLGTPAEYSLEHYRHQLPGGMMGTFRNQLRDRGIEARLPELLEEVARIRVELGYPVMATPFSQLVGIQAVLNLTGTGERYALVPDEVLLLVYGHYGKPAAPLDQNILDKITSSPAAKKFEHWAQAEPTIEELERTHGPHRSRDDLLLQLMVPEHFIAALKTPSAPKQYTGHAQTLSVIKSFIQSRSGERVHIECPDFTLSLRGGCHG